MTTKLEPFDLHAPDAIRTLAHNFTRGLGGWDRGGDIDVSDVAFLIQFVMECEEAKLSAVRGQLDASQAALAEEHDHRLQVEQALAGAQRIANVNKEHYTFAYNRVVALEHAVAEAQTEIPSKLSEVLSGKLLGYIEKLESDLDYFKRMVLKQHGGKGKP
jgi:hypothetical protein